MDLGARVGDGLNWGLIVEYLDGCLLTGDWSLEFGLEE
jgi:hypothetical protein